MKDNKIKKANTSPEGQAGSENMSTADVDAVMKKYDRESNIRVWTGKYKLAVRGLLVAFSLWCIYVTLFATFLEEIRLTSFLGLIILIGFLTYPAKKGDIRENYMPIGDIIFMIAGTGAFLYFTFSANQIINQGTRFAPYQIVIGIIGIAALIFSSSSTLIVFIYNLPLSIKINHLPLMNHPVFPPNSPAIIIL